jgi:hypothetical protein
MRKTNTFIAMNRKWMIRHLMADYLRAKNMFANMSRDFQSGRPITFEHWRKLSDLLFEIKENMHLLFRKLIDPKTMRFEESDKIIPSPRETAWLNNVGLLFHKSMVARELKYVMDHYTIDSTDYVNSNMSLGSYIERIQSFFASGTETIKELFRDYSDNETLLYYIMENDRYIQDTLGEKAVDVLMDIFTAERLPEAYVEVGRYCLESGWRDRARKLLAEAVRLDSNHLEARHLLAVAKSAVS